jgi:hypothetical protein
MLHNAEIKVGDYDTITQRVDFASLPTEQLGAVGREKRLNVV